MLGDESMRRRVPMFELILAAMVLIVTLWLGAGLWMICVTPSRGWKADLQFVFWWPLHWYFEIWKGHGRD